MKDLALRILALRPGARFPEDVILTDDGAGPRIEKWNLPGSPPAEAELLAVPEEALDLLRADRAALAAEPRLDEIVDALLEAAPASPRLGDLRDRRNRAKEARGRLGR